MVELERAEKKIARIAPKDPRATARIQRARRAVMRAIGSCDLPEMTRTMSERPDACRVHFTSARDCGTCARHDAWLLGSDHP